MALRLDNATAQYPPFWTPPILRFQANGWESMIGGTELSPRWRKSHTNVGRANASRKRHSFTTERNAGRFLTLFGPKHDEQIPGLRRDHSKYRQYRVSLAAMVRPVIEQARDHGVSGPPPQSAISH
jgi:hypothetical protein